MFDLSRSIEASRHSPVRVVFAALAGSTLIAVSAKAHVPFWPVPMTLQVLAIMGLAVAFGPSIGLGMVAAYLVEGTLGLPVFSGTPERGIGVAYMLGPTGGYLLGMPIAAWAVGRLAEGRSAFGRFAAMLVGLALIYVPSLLWLARFIPWSGVLAAGFTPFILGDLVKIALVAAGAEAARRFAAERR